MSLCSGNFSCIIYLMIFLPLVSSFSLSETAIYSDIELPNVVVEFFSTILYIA